MIEINFFEKKARNILPYLLGALLLLGLLVIGLYLFLMHSLYASQDVQNLEQIARQSEDVALSREMQRLSRETEQNAQVVSNFEDSRYPIVFLTADIANSIPESEETVISFNLNSPEELVLELNQSQIQASADLISTFEDKSYVNHVLFDRLISEREGDEHVIQLTLIINQEAMREEAER
ncbi:hypothetical protein ADIAL_2004 [Alkalibacterium sp. AK22]|uniref:hypothetical protein n=1 Tax=Alkalibacterium sp. AK22 TaxID=1229520 RepID=UPI0004513BF7|nr:hypothetical protein [Alkalibacterium sp. AK22]EXJ22418.1 hypothetical protein ADIAL_2004 [Alkalibacterium sp. AK22]